MLKEVANKAVRAFAKRSENSINVAASDARQSGNRYQGYFLRDIVLSSSVYGGIMLFVWSSCNAMFADLGSAGEQRDRRRSNQEPIKDILESPVAEQSFGVMKVYKSAMNQWR